MVISPAKKHIAIMYSNPNRMPLPHNEVMRIKQRLEAIPFDTLYSFMRDLNLTEDVKDILKRSMERY
jgi:hypothetical protein